jgi:hypothetical protein
MPAFLAKRRHAPSNTWLPLLTLSEARHTNARLSFVTKAGASQILNKLRRVENMSVSFLPFIKPGVHLNDAGTSRFTRSETIAYGPISDLCILFEFLT